MTPLPPTTNVSDIACPRCAQDWLRLWALPDGSQVHICDECRAVWPLGTVLSRRTYTYYTDFMQERGLDPAADVFTAVPVEPTVWSALTPPQEPPAASGPAAPLGCQLRPRRRVITWSRPFRHVAPRVRRLRAG